MFISLSSNVVVLVQIVDELCESSFQKRVEVK